MLFSDHIDKMARARSTLLVVLVVGTTPICGSAESRAAYTSEEGHRYELTCNNSGAVLTSTYPVERFFGEGAGTTVRAGREVIYFGRSCDAFKPSFGTGTWRQSNGAFGADFDQKEFVFPRQELICDAPNELPYCDCRD
jgi:hypothetical protein